MARLRVNPGILGQRGRVYGWPYCDNPRMDRLLGNPGILVEGGRIWLSILG